MTVKLWRKHLFQSTPPVKAATPFYCLYVSTGSISIHAAREGGDALAVYIVKKDKISIHAAREGGDVSARSELSFNLFQSTPPVKAATYTYI